MRRTAVDKDIERGPLPKSMQSAKKKRKGAEPLDEDDGCSYFKKDGVTCSLCDTPKKNGQFCPIHKTAYECIYRGAMSDDGLAKPSDDALWDDEVDAWVGSDKHIFVQVFGNG